VTYTSHVSTQEEADTRIVLYALNADRLYRENKVKGRIVVKSPDTDVLVLLINYFRMIIDYWFPDDFMRDTHW
jgi:hypothetical protein